MKTTRILISVIFTTILFSLISCDDDYEPAPRRLVVDGWINTDNGPTVILTMAYSPDKAGNVKDMLIQWGKVSITDGIDTVVLTGGIDNDFFPPYKYSTYRMTGQPGKTYTIIAEYDGLTATATSTMLTPVPIDTIEFRPVEHNDSLRSGLLRFTAPDDCPAYFYVMLRKIKGHDISQQGLSLLSPVTAEVPGQEIEIPVYNTKNVVDSTSYVADFWIGDELEINLCRVEKKVYDFWFAFDNYTLFGNSQFITGQSAIEGNVEGGLGIFGAQATSSRYIKLE